jgi:two-component system, NtrC family, nitrogen regulation sensor histidine kinase NtrY
MQLDDRRRFTEAMLAGVSAGVIGLDAAHNISLLNRSALSLLGLQERMALGRPLVEVLPEFGPLMEHALSRPSGQAEGQIERQKAGRDISLFLRITTEASTDASHDQSCQRPAQFGVG